MKITVESWAPEYGSPFESGELDEAEVPTDLQVELGFANGSTGQLADGDDTNPDNDYDDIDTIKIRLKAQARRKDKDIKGGGLLEQEYAVSVSPRNQLYTRNRN